MERLIRKTEKEKKGSKKKNKEEEMAEDSGDVTCDRGVDTLTLVYRLTRTHTHRASKQTTSTSHQWTGGQITLVTPACLWEKTLKSPQPAYESTEVNKGVEVSVTFTVNSSTLQEKSYMYILSSRLSVLFSPTLTRTHYAHLCLRCR